MDCVFCTDLLLFPPLWFTVCYSAVTPLEEFTSTICEQQIGIWVFHLLLTAVSKVNIALSSITEDTEPETNEIRWLCTALESTKTEEVSE